MKVSREYRFPWLRAVHWTARQVLERTGYTWELRRRGELKIGLWRKSFRRDLKKKPHVKRFVLVPGFGDTSLSWFVILALLRPVLRARYDEVVLLDFPGFGGFLSRERAFDSMDLLVDAVSDVFDTLKPDTVLGHSLGGWLTSLYAVACGAGTRPAGRTVNYQGPELIILVDPPGLFESPDRRKEFEGVFQRVVEKGLVAWRPFIFGKEPVWFRFFAGEVDSFLGKTEVHQFMGSVKDEHFLADSIEKIRSRVWLLWGEKDTLIPPVMAEHWTSRLKAGTESSGREVRAVVLKGVGHSPQIENPVTTAAALANLYHDKIPQKLMNRWCKVT
ncbi:MAG TPA: alpha/beta hydrolase [Bdellovibrionota bacterium]|nr:alpha/beta hydrolase [Bdellovibrionota bacterium]